MSKRFVVVAPLTFTGAASKGFTYALPEDAEAVAGSVVKVPLGRRTSLGVVTEVSDTTPAFATKPVSEVLDLAPLPDHLVKLAAWMSEYYYSSPKAVWQTLLPAGITKKRRVKTSVKPFELAAQTQDLTDEQRVAFDAIMASVKTSVKTFLLQGVTGSGKTRLYLELATATLAAGESVIVLVPEIALSPQLIALFEASFPGRVVAFHSALTEAEKHVAWQRALETKEPLVVVGARSGLFLPLPKLGLIVIDECHETTYKQEQNPRYHAITTAAKLAQLSGARLVLGSATPGLPEVYAAEAGKTTLLKLTKRVANRPLPTTHIIDMRDELMRTKNSFISKPLAEALRQTLADGRQSLLFINRRGSASSLICNDCGFVATCPTCHLPLTFHADELKLICHVCNYRAAPPAVCPECKHTDLRYLGGGTKRIEAEIAKLFPDVRVARIDKDSADVKTLPDIYKQLHAGEIDILIGTQMIAKGLDLPNLDTVGVVSADGALHMPDFSSAERTFQLLEQVAGRAGRGDRPGNVYIQTRTPDHPAIQAAAKHDFWTFAGAEMNSRKELGYPPYRFLLKLSAAAKTQDDAIKLTTDLQKQLASNPAVKVLGPAPAFHERAAGMYTWQLVVKAARRGALLDIAASLPATWKTDIDPVNVL